MTFDALPTLIYSWEIFRNLWMLLPLLPLAGILLILMTQYGFPRNVSSVMFHLVIGAQITLGLTLLAAAGTHGIEPREMAVSLWDYAIVFRVEPLKIILLAILMVPLVLALPKYQRIENPYLRIIFLFFLAGCSGVIVTGDIFNLFVFYELMIMAAYVLVAAKQNFAESIKYMMFGSISSIAFLGGIIVLYAGGAPFNMDAQIFTTIPTANAWWAMVLFTFAFGVKSAFFPIALAPCHAAAGSLFSAFLASFTIFTGMIGLHFLVLQPAALLDMTAFYTLIRTLSILTIIMPSVILFWEPEYNRAVAQSTIIAIGITGLLLSYGAQEYAFLFVLVHAAYKSMLFMLGDELQQTARALHVHAAATLGILGMGVFLASGFTPGLSAHFKSYLENISWWMQAMLLFSGWSIIGGMVKFRYTRKFPTCSNTIEWRRYAWYALCTGLILFLYHQLGPPAFLSAKTLLEGIILFTALILGRRIYNTFPRMVSLDRNWIYGLLNRQLLYIIFLFAFILLWLYPTSRQISNNEPPAEQDPLLHQTDPR